MFSLTRQCVDAKSGWIARSAEIPKIYPSWILYTDVKEKSVNLYRRNFTIFNGEKI